jgi:hypothetical protein
VLTGGAWFKRGTARRWVFVGVAGAVAAAGASVAVALGGDRTPAAAPLTTSHSVLPRALPKPANCMTWGCTKAQSVDLGNGYAISLWHAGKSGDMRTDPVVELTDRGVSVQWLLWSRGYGWSGSLKCSSAAAEPSCIITDGAGVHSAAAQLVILRSGKLVFPAKAYVIADLPTITVRDLDDDGDLDVVALDSDYTPNFAEGHLYWRTYRNAAGQLLSTGCVRRNSPAEPAPITLLTGACPHP